MTLQWTTLKSLSTCAIVHVCSRTIQYFRILIYIYTNTKLLFILSLFSIHNTFLFNDNNILIFNDNNILILNDNNILILNGNNILILNGNNIFIFNDNNVCAVCIVDPFCPYLLHVKLPRFNTFIFYLDKCITINYIINI